MSFTWPSSSSSPSTIESESYPPSSPRTVNLSDHLLYNQLQDELELKKALLESLSNFSDAESKGERQLLETKIVSLQEELAQMSDAATSSGMPNFKSSVRNPLGASSINTRLAAAAAVPPSVATSQKRIHDDDYSLDLTHQKDAKTRRTLSDTNSTFSLPYGHAGPSSVNERSSAQELSDYELALSLNTRWNTPYAYRSQPAVFSSNAHQNSSLNNSNRNYEVIDLLDDDEDIPLVFGRAGIKTEPTVKYEVKHEPQFYTQGLRSTQQKFERFDNSMFMPGAFHDNDVQVSSPSMFWESQNNRGYIYDSGSYSTVKHETNNGFKVETFKPEFQYQSPIIIDSSESPNSEYYGTSPNSSNLDELFAMMEDGQNQGMSMYDIAQAQRESVRHRGEEAMAIKGLLNSMQHDVEEVAPEGREQTPRDLKIKLMEHQKIGLAWLKLQEDGRAKGGILADDMGLGKTVQALALMVSRRSVDPARKTNLIVAPVALLRQWKLEIEQKVKASRSLSVYLHHGTQKKLKTFSQMAEYDVVLTSYGTLAAEFKKLEQWEARNTDYPQERLNEREIVFLHDDALWYRVILDEAQYIKNHATQSSRGVSRLRSVYRWCLSGTPAQNSAAEFYSHIRFLRLKPYNDRALFQRDFGIPLKKGGSFKHDKAMERLHGLVKAMLFRRTKTSMIDGEPILQLLPKTVEVVHAVFSDEQKEYYESLEMKTQLKINKYLKAGTVLKEYHYILVLLLRLRQAACHPFLINDLGVPVDLGAEGNEHIVAMLKEFSEETIARVKEAGAANEVDEELGAVFECPVCYEPTANPQLVVSCGHDICSECLAKVIDQHNAQAGAQGVDATAAKCPECRGPLISGKTVDYASFRAFHFPDETLDNILDKPADVNSSSDSEDDSESSEEGDEGSNLGGFIVDDEYESGDDTNDDENNADPFDFPGAKQSNSRKAKASKGNGKVVRKSATDKDDFSDDEFVFPSSGESETGETKDRKRKGMGMVIGNFATNEDNSTEDEFTRDDGSNEYKAFIKRKIQKEKEAAKVKAKGKGKAIKKSKTPVPSKKARGKLPARRPRKVPVTMGEKRREAFRTKKGKKKFLKRLAKDWESSAKIDKCVEILTNIQQKEPKEKTLVFSQWTSLLDLLEIPLMRAGIVSSRYDGSMSATDRNEAVLDFQDESKGIAVMLVSLKAGNAGLNLVAASQVIILDPFWNGYVEAQAIDRAHRIGQDKEVFVHRIIVQGTVEDRILAIQEQKRNQIEAALDENARARISRLGVQELGFLFGLNNLDGAH